VSAMTDLRFLILDMISEDAYGLWEIWWAAAPHRAVSAGGELLDMVIAEAQGTISQGLAVLWRTDDPTDGILPTQEALRLLADKNAWLSPMERDDGRPAGFLRATDAGWEEYNRLNRLKRNL